MGHAVSIPLGADRKVLLQWPDACTPVVVPLGPDVVVGCPHYMPVVLPAGSEWPVVPFLLCAVSPEETA